MNTKVAHFKEKMQERKHSGVYWQQPVGTYYMDAYLENLHEIPVLREARALRHFWKHTPIFIFGDEIITGNFSFREVCLYHFAGGSTIHHHNVEEWIRQQKLSTEEEQELRIRLADIEAHRYRPGNAGIFSEQELASLWAKAAHTTYFGGHMVMDYPTVLNRGLASLLEEAKMRFDSANEKEERDFYEAMAITAEGIQYLIGRFADAAESLAVYGIGEQKSRLHRMAVDLAQIAAHPPQTFRQAIQLVWFIHLLSDCDSLGRFDQYLYPFYAADAAKGQLDEEQALELLEGFIIKMEENGAIQNTTIGGMKPDGTPAYNELTRLMLVATRDLGFSGPNLCLRICNGMPDSYWDEVHANLSTGQGLPALYNDHLIIESLVKNEIELEDARNYCLAGCSQIMIPGISNFVNDIGILNVAKCLELTYRNGFDPVIGKQVGLRTGEPQDFHNFEQFMEAFEQQMQYFCKLEADINNKDTLHRRATEGYAVRCLFTGDCLERGTGIWHGGARYNNTQLECLGITNAADSLMGIKKAVFDDKKVSFAELVNILDRNFEGHEELRRYLVNDVPKFGNDQEDVDAIRARISQFIFDALRSQPSVIGGKYIPGEVIFVAHEDNGNVVGATPDGRLSGQVLADSAGASQGMDRNGPTALMNSVLKIPADDIFTCIVLNMKFMKNLWMEPASKPKIITLFKSFLRRGGMQMQVNVCDNSVLQDAVVHPEKYHGLVVRVGGYSAYFTQLSRALQQDIIDRMSH